MWFLFCAMCKIFWEFAFDVKTRQILKIADSFAFNQKSGKSITALTALLVYGLAWCIKRYEFSRVLHPPLFKRIQAAVCSNWHLNKRRQGRTNFMLQLQPWTIITKKTKRCLVNQPPRHTGRLVLSVSYKLVGGHEYG